MLSFTLGGRSLSKGGRSLDLREFLHRVLAGVLILAFVVSDVSVYAQGAVQMPVPGAMVSLSDAFTPPLLKGIKIFRDDPFRFDFILDGGVKTLHATSLHADASRLIKYFLAALTVPEKDLWVNLSPYEKDRIVPEAFGQTEMGRDLLAQDYILKQITASVIYPEGEVGKAFWAKVYAEAQKQYGTTDIPVDTFNKVWIVPEKATVFENDPAHVGAGSHVRPQEAAAFVIESRLKVMLESDYLAMDHNGVGAASGRPSDDQGGRPEVAPTHTNELTKNIIREIILPILEKEVNEGKNFTALRQVYNSLILATWYKRKVKDSIMGQGYVDQKKTGGIDIADKNEKEKIWAQYVETFKKGAFNFIREEQDPVTQEAVPRKYFSGGWTALGLDKAMQVTVDVAALPMIGIEHTQVLTVAMAIATTDLAQASEQGWAKVSLRRWLKRGVLASAICFAVAGTAGYAWMRWGYETSLQHLVTIPKAQPEVTFQDGRIITYDGDPFQVSGISGSQIEKINAAIVNKRADREFWTEIFRHYPESAPVSAIVTFNILQAAQQRGQLNALFNGLRTRPELVYRYLSEISYDQMQEFSRYFSQLKPGIRQQIFDVFYRRLMEDFENIENGKLLKSVVFKPALEQAERMRKLYGEMTRMLNVIQPLQEGQIPEGPLAAVPDVPVAPFEAVAFTQQQSTDEIYGVMEDLIQEYRQKGYSIVMPSPGNVSMGDIEGLVSHYESSYMAGQQSYFVDNKAGLLLRWVAKMTNADNPLAHRITQRELITQAFKLAEDPDSRKVDLFNVIGTISHLFKSLARSNSRLLEAVLAMEGQDGTDYIWNHFQPGIMAFSLYRNRAISVDDQGRPVMFWRPVDLDGNDRIPAGQRTGIKRPDTGHDFYHGWGVLLTSIYTSLKSIQDVKSDLKNFPSWEGVKYRFFGEDGLITTGDTKLISSDMTYLPLFFKAGQLVGLDNFGLHLMRFSAKNGSEPDIIFNDIGKRIVESISNGELVLDRGRSPVIVTLGLKQPKPPVQAVLGGVDLDGFVVDLNNRWSELRQKSSVKAIQDKIMIIIAADRLLGIEDDLGKQLGISFELRSYLNASVAANRLSEDEARIMFALVDQMYGVLQHNKFDDVKVPFILDLVANAFIDPRLAREAMDDSDKISAKQQVALVGKMLPETYERMSKDTDVFVRVYLTRNKYIPQEMIVRLLADKDPRVVLAATDKFLQLFGYDQLPQSIENAALVTKLASLLNYNDQPLALRLNNSFELIHMYPQVDSYDWRSTLMDRFKWNVVERHFYDVLNKWMQVNPGHKMPRRVYDLLLKKHALIEQAKWFDEGSLPNLKGFKSVGDLEVDVSASIKAIEADMALNDADQKTGKKDPAMMDSPGGIDLTRDKMRLQVQNDRQDFHFNFDPAMIQRLKDSTGLTPVIIDIQSMTTTLPMFLGVETKGHNN